MGMSPCTGLMLDGRSNRRHRHQKMPTGTGLRPRDRFRRGTTCRGERTGERERLRREAC